MGVKRGCKGDPSKGPVKGIEFIVNCSQSLGRTGREMHKNRADGISYQASAMKAIRWCLTKDKFADPLHKNRLPYNSEAWQGREVYFPMDWRFNGDS